MPGFAKRSLLLLFSFGLWPAIAWGELGCGSWGGWCGLVGNPAWGFAVFLLHHC